MWIVMENRNKQGTDKEQTMNRQDMWRVIESRIRHGTENREQRTENCIYVYSG